MPTYKYTPKRNFNNVVQNQNNDEQSKKEENIVVKKDSVDNTVSINNNETKQPVILNKQTPLKPVSRNETKEILSEQKSDIKETINTGVDEPIVLKNINIVEDVEEEKTTNAPKTKPIKNKTVTKKRKKPILSAKSLKKIVGLIAVAVILFAIISGLSNTISNSTDNYTITNEHLKNRVVQGINPGDLIDIENSLPLQITSKDLAITDYTNKDTREIQLWDYTNTNLNKINIKVNDELVIENTVLKKKPISLTIPAESRLEITIAEEVSSEYMTYAIQVGDNTYFNKLSVSRGNVLYFTNPLAEEQ